MADDRNYYVICDDNCKFEGMTKEQTIASIAEATGATPTQIDAAFITKIKEQNRNTPLKFWIGTQAEYNALEETDENTFYIFSDSDELSMIEQIAEAKVIGITTPIQEDITKAQEDIAEIETFINAIPEKGKVLYENSTGIAAFTTVSVTVNDLSKYTVLMVQVGAVRCLCFNDGQYIIGSGSHTTGSNAGALFQASAQLIYTGNKITMSKSQVFTVNGTSHTAPQGQVITKIIGIM